MLVYRTVLKESELHCPKPTKIHSETRGFGSKSKRRGHIALIIIIVIMIMMSVPRRQCVSGSCNIHEIVLNEVLSNHLYSGELIFCIIQCCGQILLMMSLQKKQLKGGSLSH